MATNRQTITAAIRSLGLRVTAADVASTTGLPLHVVIRELNHIAADTLAVLQVSNAGTIAYKFNGDPDAVYAAKGAKKALNAMIDKARAMLFFAVRCSFGVLLLGSIITLLIIFLVAIAFAMFASDAADGELDIMGDAGEIDTDMEWNFFDVLNLSMFFSWWHRDVSGDVDYYGRKIQVRETGFISNCFSFLFGDGDPNRKFDETVWTSIADLIRLHNGVITAAQVGPYMMDCATDAGMFPVLVRFDGVPEVTATGNIVYVFPSMLSTAAGHVFRGIPQFAEAKQWKFSEVPARRLDFVFYFAGANLAGWWAISGNLHHFPMLSKYSPYVSLLLCYAVFFIAFPMGRSLVNAVRNAVVDVQNNQRKRNAEALAKTPMQVKIQEAQTFAMQMQWHDPAQVAYTTAETLLDQELDVLPPLKPMQPIIPQYVIEPAPDR